MAEENDALGDMISSSDELSSSLAASSLQVRNARRPFQLRRSWFFLDQNVRAREMQCGEDHATLLPSELYSKAPPSPYFFFLKFLHLEIFSFLVHNMDLVPSTTTEAITIFSIRTLSLRFSQYFSHTSLAYLRVI
ncbi:hypothetical protein VNO77_23496 [Canavalia gladiata]|uniref:Uncharacterized protein n=1 Tax=Canavalia gladiata TaxID=3824 RepID=A0AAN9L4K0_CANGL